MKKTRFWVLFVLIAGVYSISIINGDSHHKKEMELINQRFDQLDSIMTHRSQLDSLYWNHLEECAFQLRPGLKYSNHN